MEHNEEGVHQSDEDEYARVPLEAITELPLNLLLLDVYDVNS